MGSMNSIISDPAPYQAPKPKKAQKPKATDWEKLGKSTDYPEIHTYLEGRKEFFRRYLPDGTPVEKLSNEEKGAAWGQSLCVIKEIEAIQAAIAAHTQK